MLGRAANASTLTLLGQLLLTPFYAALVTYYLPHELGHVAGAIWWRRNRVRPQVTLYTGSRSRARLWRASAHLTISLGAPTVPANNCVWWNWADETVRRRRLAIALGPVFELTWLFPALLLAGGWRIALVAFVAGDFLFQLAPVKKLPNDGALLRSTPVIHPPC